MTALTVDTTVTTRPVTVHSHSAAVFFCREWSRRILVDALNPPSVLVAGCGAGHEAAYIAETFPAKVEAFDIEHAPDPQLLDLPNVHFRAASVEDMPYENASFDSVFYHHVIEHVGNPRQSLREIARVLKPGGWLFVGTPNRHRLISAAGAHEQRDWKPSFRTKLRENLQDWSARLRGRFRNEYGAHAGFSTGELDRLLAEHFPERQWVTTSYLRCKYLRHRLELLVHVATTRPVCWFMAPSIYAFCQKAN